ncbi:MAG: DNA (cytosine-5-)-methyltransferase [Elusimicrobia bacterium]|nr:DNA (cytosine-5-)-methyltransferase [Elusimicrobiota bacterium]
MAHHSQRLCRASSPKCHRCPLISFCQTGLANHRHRVSDRPTVLDLFAGAGGLSAGFLREGFRIVLAIEKSRHAAQTYRHNHPGVPVLEMDARSISPARVAEISGLALGKLSLVMGGPPCQGYSAAGLRKPGARQNLLYRVIANMAHGLQSPILVMENVPGLMRVAGVNFKTRILGFIEDHGFSAKAVELDASKFGVPQRRQRLIFVAARKNLKLRPEALVPPGRRGKRTVAAVLKGLPKLAPGQGNDVMTIKGRLVYNHRAMTHGPAVVAKIRKIQPGNGPLSYRRLPTTLAHTIIAGHRALPVHPLQDRTITVREAARLQTLPDWFRFLGPHAEQPLQVANAVPYNMARALARAALRTLKQI